MSLPFDATLKEILGYDVVRLWKQPVAPFLTGGLSLLPLAPLCEMPKDKPLAEAIRDVVMEIDRRLAQAPDHAKAVRLMTATFILAGMRVKKETLSDIFDGVRIMHESTAYDVAVAEGRVKGIAEGRVEGEIRLLRRLGRNRLGVPDAATEAALAAIQDIDRLERMADALETAKTWQELLSIP